MNYPAPQIEVVANDIPNPFDENNECGESQAPKSSCNYFNISDDTQIHRYKGNADTKDTQDVLPVCFSSIKDEIDYWIPEKGGVNNEHMFNICRLLKTAEREIRRSLELYEIRQVFNYWADKAKRFFKENKTNEDYFAEFVTIFDATKFAHDESPVTVAYKLARESPPPPGYEKLETDDFVLLAGVCYQLHLISGGPFYLSCRKAAEVLKGVGFNRISVRLRYLVRLGLLRIVEKGGPKSYKASTYEYILPSD